MQTENTQTQPEVNLQQTRQFQTGSTQPRALNPNTLEGRPVTLTVEGPPYQPPLPPAANRGNPLITTSLIALTLVLGLALAAVMLNWKQLNRKQAGASEPVDANAQKNKNQIKPKRPNKRRRPRR